VIDVTPLVGLRIRLKRTIDVPCGTSGETVVVIVAGPWPRAPRACIAQLVTAIVAGCRR
jgi:hypothetical protein